MKTGPHWWSDDPSVKPCPCCGCPIQRSSTGTVLDGLRAHFSYVHPERALIRGTP